VRGANNARLCAQRHALRVKNDLASLRHNAFLMSDEIVTKLLNQTR
jgi:hypothetical protein